MVYNKSYLSKFYLCLSLLVYIEYAHPILLYSYSSDDYIKELHLETDGKKIRQLDKIRAQLSIISEDIRLTVLIKKRGSSSRLFPKKQYSVKLVDEKENKKELSLLGMPKSAHWVLYGPFVDRSYIRNALAYTVGREISKGRGEYFSPRYDFVWCSINGNDKGLYLLSEKIKRHKDRVNISSFKTYKGLNEAAFITEISAGAGDFTTSNKTSIRYRYPSSKDLDSLKTQSFLEYYRFSSAIKLSFEEVEKKILFLQDSLDLLGRDVDVDSLVDYILIQEVFKNIDGYRRSVYLHRPSKGKLVFGPIWDFNLAMGNVVLHGMQSSCGWLLEKKIRFLPHAFYFNKVWQSREFRSLFRERYLKLRQDVLSDHNINTLITCLANKIDKYANRDRDIWYNKESIVFKIFLNTREKAVTFKQHIQVLNSWMLSRLQWMDEHILRLNL